jgi:hypothetical protein
MFLVTVSPVNDAPISADDSYATSEDTPLTILAPAGVLANDSDVDGDALEAVLDSGPSHGLVTLNVDGSFSYTPDAGFSGEDHFVYHASDGSTISTEAIVTIHVSPGAEPGVTKFFVVDRGTHGTFKYDEFGNSRGDSPLNSEDKEPRGIAANPDGSTFWVVDEKGEVFVYDNRGDLLGSWEVEGVDKLEGITVDGNDLWAVDRGEGRVYRFEGAASLRSGHAKPTSSFRLARGNRRPMDLVTDGSYIWVVNDGHDFDSVYRYDTKGNPAGSWQIDPENSEPTGLTIDPHDVNDIWIVDAHSHSIYQYYGATGRSDGEQPANVTMPLAATNLNPQGIADPRPAMERGVDDVIPADFSAIAAAVHDAFFSEYSESDDLDRESTVDNLDNLLSDACEFDF